MFAAFIYWSLWKCRNDLMFRNKLWDPFDAAQRALKNFTDFRNICSQHALFSLPLPSALIRLPSWIAPPLGRFKLKFDASSNPISKFCGGGLLLRNHLGQPIQIVIVFFRNVCSSSVAEGLVLQESFQLIKCWGYSNVVFEGDCKPVMSLFPTEEALVVIFEDVFILLTPCSEASLVWTPRLCNVVAHLLSKWLWKSIVVTWSGAYGSNGC
ncbi:uncharacterized protein LOC132269787 [Cornus florida]|uniref:uncharacterized protein LOC132269787 n=1 Tax=Cornus florida TaxID=4283 RepID=UPI0028A1F0E0|nr:uncharacterized protein LOC132269787 [Cornus florida]